MDTVLKQIGFYFLLYLRMEEPKANRFGEYSSQEDWEAESFKNNAAKFLVSPSLSQIVSISQGITTGRTKLMLMYHISDIGTTKLVEEGRKL